jgi:hypothetical protein
MADLVAESAEATEWMSKVRANYANNPEFGRVVSSVIWADARGPNGKQLVPLDPDALVTDINTNGYRLLEGHDPGQPRGKVLAAATFTSADGLKFVAALLGFYQGKTPLGFHDLGVDPTQVAAYPSRPPNPPEEIWIEFCVDPREVDSVWIDDVLDTAPLKVIRQDLSHNAAEFSQEIIRVGVYFWTLVGVPFVTALSAAAGKEAYAPLSAWLRRLLGKLADRKNPILEVQSYHDGCHVSFLFRGTEVTRHYAAHDALPAAANQAARLVGNMKANGVAPKFLFYEFEQKGNLWFPSYAELHDGRLVTDNNLLIAVEKMPTGLSLGIGVGEMKTQVKSTKELGS